MQSEFFLVFVYNKVKIRSGCEKMMRYQALYDGQCKLCVQIKNNLAGWTGLAKQTGFHWKRTKKSKVLRSLTPVELRREPHLLGQNGGLYKGFSALRVMLLSFPLTFIPSLMLLYREHKGSEIGHIVILPSGGTECQDINAKISNVYCSAAKTCKYLS